MPEEIYTDTWEEGMYACKKCGTQLFPSGTKFKSGTRWPSFREAITGAVATRPDHSLGHDTDRDRLRQMRRASRSCLR